MEPSVEMIKIGGQEMALIEGKYVPIRFINGERFVLVGGKYVLLSELIKKNK